MKITLSDPGLLPDLLAFLRAEGCIAYVVGDEIEAVRPHVLGGREADELGELIGRWQADHGDVEVGLSDESGGSPASR